MNFELNQRGHSKQNPVHYMEASFGNNWNVPPANLQLGESEVHVWLAGLTLSPAQLDQMQQCLSADERDRAARFLQPSGRDEWIATRGLLRRILARYLETAPEAIRFAHNPHGKPELAPGTAAQPLRFNSSDSHGLALVAVALGRELGVDLEQIRAAVVTEEIAERFFSANEARAIRSLPEGQQVPAFFNCWTRKEAFIKAVGQGLSMPLHTFEVSLVPGEPAALLRVEDKPEELQRWTMRELHPASGYAAAIVVEGGGWELKCWRMENGARA